MILEGIIVFLVLVIAVLAWRLYTNVKTSKIEELQETFDLKYNALQETLDKKEASCSEVEKAFKKEQEECLKFQENLNEKSSEIIHISHQMRTSLSGLLGFTHFLKVSELDEEQQEFVSIIETSSNELLSLVNGIIDMTPKPADVKAKRLKERRKNDTRIQAEKNVIPRLLVVDDNEINKKLLAKVLEKENLEVSYASNGQEAVDLRKAENFDIIFMDIQMPVMNGVDASKEIRSYEKEENLMPVTIVALTANTGKDDRDSYLAAGMNDYMAKPIMIDDVRKRISDL